MDALLILTVADRQDDIYHVLLVWCRVIHDVDFFIEWLSVMIPSFADLYTLFENSSFILVGLFAG